MRNRSPRTADRPRGTRQVEGLSGVAAGTVLLGTLLFWWAEGWSVLDSFYFCVLTLATVGGGDVAPATPVGKVFAALIALAGVGILSGFVYVVVKSAMNDRSDGDI